MLEASKVTIGEKTFDMNYLNKTKKTNLRRKLIIEYIQTRPTGEFIRIKEFQEVGRFSTPANTYAFLKRMMRDGIISQYQGDRPRDRYYAVTGAVRIRKPAEAAPEAPAAKTPDINAFVEDMKRLGVKFTITITNN